MKSLWLPYAHNKDIDRILVNYNYLLSSDSINSMHPVVPVGAQRIPISLWDFKLFAIGCIGLISTHCLYKCTINPVYALTL